MDRTTAIELIIINHKLLRSIKRKMDDGGIRIGLQPQRSKTPKKPKARKPDLGTRLQKEQREGTEKNRPVHRQKGLHH